MNNNEFGGTACDQALSRTASRRRNPLEVVLQLILSIVAAVMLAGPASAEVVVIPALDFHADQWSTPDYRFNYGAHFGNESTRTVLYAPIRVPDDADISAIEVKLRDYSGLGINVALVQYILSNPGFHTVVEIEESQGVDESYRWFRMDIPSYNVNYRFRSYAVRIILERTTEHSFKQVNVEYSLPSASYEPNEPTGQGVSLNLQSHPNPFSYETEIELELPESRDVTMRIFDVGGREVATLTDGRLPAGQNRFRWDGESDFGEQLPNGSYFLSARANDGPWSTRRLIKLDR